MPSSFPFDEVLHILQRNCRIVTFNGTLFGAPEENFVSMDELMVGDIPQLGADKNEILSAPFTEKEVFEAISQMKNIRHEIQRV